MTTKEWINNITRELEWLEEGSKMEILIDLLKTTLKRISNWKAPGHDGKHGFWFKKFTSIHGRLALEMNRCLQGVQVPKWMTKEKTTLIQKDPSKGTAPNNYRPITCLSMMWKILTAQIREKIYYLLTSRRLFPDEQKGCHKGSRGTVELLYTDQHILNESKTRRKNLAMAWIDYKKAYDMVPQSWILHCLKMYKISHEVINFIEQTMKTWRVELTGAGRSIAKTKIQRGIFQGDTLSPLLFIIAMMPLNHILRKCATAYKVSRSQEMINHLMYMDDIKLFSKNEKELETLIHAVLICSQDIRMEFGIEKCAMHVMKSGKRHMTDGMELPNHDKIRMLEENETYKYLGILEADTIKQVQMKDTIRKESQENEKTTRDKNLIKGINTWAVPKSDIRDAFSNGPETNLNKWPQRTRKQVTEKCLMHGLMTMHKAFHPRDDVDRLYVSIKQEGRGLASIEDTVDVSIQRLEDYIEKHERGLITTIRNDTDNTIDERMTTTKKQKWEGKQLYGRFKRLINNISHHKTCTWLRKGNLKREMESLLIAVQDNAIRTNHIKVRIDKTQQNSKCGLCGDRDETIKHITCECSKLAQKEYKARHDWVGKVIHWEMCRKFQFVHTNNPAPVLENDSHKFLWDFNIETESTKKKENLQNWRLSCAGGQQNKSEEKWKEG